MVGTRSYFPFGLPFPIDNVADYQLARTVPGSSAYALRGSVTVPAGVFWVCRAAHILTWWVATAGNITSAITVQRPGGPEVELIRESNPPMTGISAHSFMVYPNFQAPAGTVFRFYAENLTSDKKMVWSLVLDEIDL